MALGWTVVSERKANEERYYVDLALALKHEVEILAVHDNWDVGVVPSSKILLKRKWKLVSEMFEIAVSG